MIPCSSPRSSGWRATDWIMEPKMLPMPMPAPREPRPMPSASPMAFPSLMASPAAAAASARCIGSVPPLVLGLDGRADVDGRQQCEDESLDRDDDRHLEEVDRRARHDE